MALLGVGGYLVYSNWPAISAWASSLVPTTAPAATPTSAYYPNSPVPTSYSTSQTFVDSAGNQWQFSTQTSQWVIATPHPAPAAAPVAVVPVSAGTVVSTAPAVTSTSAPLPVPGTQPPIVPTGQVISTPITLPGPESNLVLWRRPPVPLRYATLQSPGIQVVLPPGTTS